MASLRSAHVCRTASSSSLLSLTQSLTTPIKLAHLFDWKKATSNVLVVRITKQSMECAIASHPTLVKRDTSSSIQAFTLIPLQRDKSISSTSGTSDHQLSSVSSSPPPAFNVSMVTHSLQQLMAQHHVCGIIVLYPTTGPIGMKNASCGRTLHVLDHIKLPSMNAVSTGSARSGSGNHNTTKMSSSTKPICLYDPNHYQTDMMEDEWGRTPLYSRSTTPAASSAAASSTKSNEKVMVRCAQIAQSDDNSRTILEQTWNNFCHQYWPSSDVEESDDNDDLLNFMNKVSHQKNCFQMNHQHHKNMTHNNHDNVDNTSTIYQSAF
jgi:hypothetical protein